MLHGLVKIEMILREVGENGGLEIEAPHAPQLQRVRGHFHGGVRAAERGKFIQQAA